MIARIFSRVVDCALATTAISAAMLCTNVNAQTGAGLVTDPDTGIIYRPVTRTVERPVVETKIEKREQTVYRPQTVSETRPESRTVYTPVVEYKWEPKLHGRWNPFRQPTVAYHHTPSTHWEARSEVVQRTNSRTEWVAEKRSVDVPTRVVRMQRDQKVDYQVVGHVPQRSAQPQSNLPAAVASRLRPLPAGAPVAPMNSRQSFASPTQVAATNLGRLTSDPPPRTRQQGGMRATDLYRAAPRVRGQALPPISSGTGIATVPALPFFR
ncbi:MAG: hypothetical protein AB8B91_21790 [Rubripirellula sp.]